MPPFHRCILLILLVLPATPAAAEWALTLRSGTSWAGDGDLGLERPGTDVELRDVSWDDGFDASFYAGVGLTWWAPAPQHGWGLGIDYTHSSVRLDTDQTVLAQGTVDGVPVNGPQRVGDIVARFDLNHFNMITANGYWRWFVHPATGMFPGGGIEKPPVSFYVGLGAGIAVPEVDAGAGGVPTSEYQLTGPVARGLLGIDLPLDTHISLVGEAILSWSDVHADLVDGGELSTTLLMPALTIGLALRD